MLIIGIPPIPPHTNRRDVLGAAKTGSGKTLAFLVPLLERLYRARWAAGDGLGALVISPTRELAMQIFEVLRSVGAAHYALSAGLVCGGKGFEEEAAAIGRMAVLVATPGRLLQHLEQSPELDASGLSILVLDEADRLLDMGFADTLNAILGYLPHAPTRQTLLYSATQTRSVRDLARLSLAGSPEYVSAHETAAYATPSRLAHSYVTVKLGDKLNVLYSFVRSHTAAKTIVFVSSGKQARFLFEAFRRLRPGVPLQLLHGKMKQARRQLVYYDFIRKPAAVLFATDIAARGLDFPDVDWVFQVDAPDDAATYIHRVGRTARFRAKGAGLLLLTPAEAPRVLKELAAARVAPTSVAISAQAALSVTGKLAAEVAADPALKSLAARSFASYVRSVYLAPGRGAADVRALPLPEFAESLGLAAAPDLPLVRRLAAGDTTGAPADPDDERAVTHAKKNANKALARLKESIAQAKAAKRAAAGAAVGGAVTGARAPAAAEARDDTSNDSDDSDGEGASSSGSSGSGDAAAEGVSGRDAAAAAWGTGGRSAAAGGTELLRVVKRHPGDAAASAEDAVDDDLTGGALVAALPAPERARVARVAATTIALGAPGGGELGADGLTPFQRIVADMGSSGSQAAAATTASAPVAGKSLSESAAAHAARVAARLASVAARDREAEQARVRAKHQLQRRRAKGIADGDDDDDADRGKVRGMPQSGGGVRLGGASDDDDDEHDDDDNDDAQSSSSSSEESDARPARRSGERPAQADAASRPPPPPSAARRFVVAAPPSSRSAR